MREADALPQHPGHLGDIAVGVAVGRAAADHDEAALVESDVALGALQRRVDAIARGRKQLCIDAEVAAHVQPQTMLLRIDIEHGGDVVLHMPGGEQHSRHREHVVDTASPQRIQTVANDRPGELEIAHRDRPLR